MHVPVEGMNWTVSEVAKSKDADAFVKLHMKDVGVYPTLSTEAKEAALRLAYSLCVPEQPKPEQQKKKKDD